MAVIRYSIAPSHEGWRVACNDVLGQPYSRQADAVHDTLFMAEQLRKAGETVEVWIVELEGLHPVWRALEPQDARLYR